MIVPLLTSAVCIEANGEKLSLAPSEKSKAVAEVRENDIFAKGDAKSIVNRNEDTVVRKRQSEREHGRSVEHDSRSRDDNSIDVRVPRSDDANLARKMAKDALKSPRMQETMRKLTHGRRRLRKPKFHLFAKSPRRKPWIPRKKHGRRMKPKRRKKKPRRRPHRRYRTKQASLQRRGSSKSTLNIRRDINANAKKLNGNEKSIVKRTQAVADDKSRNKHPLQKSNTKITAVKIEDNDYIDFSTPLNTEYTVPLIETRNDDDEFVKLHDNENMIERLMKTTTKDPLKKRISDQGVEYSDYYSEDDVLQDIAANKIPIRVVDPRTPNDRFTRQSVNSTSFYTDSQIDSNLQPYYGDYDARGNDFMYNDNSANNFQSYPIDQHLTGFDRNSRFLGAGEPTNYKLPDDRNENLNIAYPVNVEGTSVQDPAVSGLQNNYYTVRSNLQSNPLSVNADQFNYANQYGNEASNLNLNGAQNLNLNGVGNLNSNADPSLNLNEAQNLNSNKAPYSNSNGAPNLNLNEAPNLNLNEAPNLNSYEAQNLNMNKAPYSNSNGAPNLNLNEAPNLNSNEAQNLNMNKAPYSNSNGAPNLNLNEAPNLNSNEAQNLNMNKAPYSNSNGAPNLNLNEAPNLNLNEAPNLNSNEAQNLNLNKAPYLNSNVTPSLNLNEAQNPSSNDGISQTMATKVICLPNEHPVAEVPQFSKSNIPVAQNVSNYQSAMSQQHLGNIEQSTINRPQVGSMRLPGTKEEDIDARSESNFKDVRNQSLQNYPMQERNELPSVKLPNPMNQPLGKVLESLGINVNTDSSNPNQENVAPVSWSTHVAQPLNNNSLSFSNMLDRPLDRKLSPSYLRKNPGDDLQLFLAARTKNVNMGEGYTRRQLDQTELLNTNEGQFNETGGSKNSNKNVSLAMNDTKEIANQLLDTIMDELELKADQGKNKKREGSWSTTQAGMKLDMKVVNRTIIVTVPDLAPPRFHESLLNGTWNVSGHAPFKRGSPFTLIATNNRTSSIAVFVGACRVCQGIDTIAGVWSVAQPPKDCKDFQVATNVFNDIFRKMKRSSLKEKVTNATKITTTTTETSS